MPKPNDVLYIPKKSKASWDGIKKGIINFLEPEHGYSDLACKERKAILLYIIDKDEPGPGAKSTNLNDICDILKEYDLDCEENKNLSYSIGNITGQIGRLPFIGGSGWKGHYFLIRMYEDVRDKISDYVEKYRCSEV